MHLKNVTLELSSKAFKDESEERMYSVCRKMFSQWKPLTEQADAVSVMLWISDGSEILEYTGDLSQKFEWAYWCGFANHSPRPEHPTERQKRNTFMFPQKYLPDAAPRPYFWLKRLIEVIRETGREIAERPIRIGATFDNGPEFAFSKFKYEKHREITNGYRDFSVVLCTSRLHADPQPYAAFPGGIPEGTSLGTFLARQYREFAKDLGYDFIWLSNGMGFGTEAWGISGMLFDRHEFHPEKADEAARLMLDFWKDFTEAYPGAVIETRGSNYSAGVEIATDACPIRELYRDYKIAPPVNSPWAALNFDSGLEIVAWMSHIAELPDERIPFRFYVHDPWFMNSPWLDRYGREPWDIFLPMSISRVTAGGKTKMANSISILTVDDTWGNMPDQVPMEVIPILTDAFKNGPDAPGPLVWVYPFDEYTDHVRGSRRIPDVVFNEDMFIGECVQGGLPLNTVISTDNFRTLENNGETVLDGHVLIVPVSAAEKETLQILERKIRRGETILFYGSLKAACPGLRRLLGLKTAEELTGEVSFEFHLRRDEYRQGEPAETAHILPAYDGGGLCEVPEGDGDTEIRAWAVQNGEKRVVASIRKFESGGAAGFVRSILPCNPNIHPGRDFARFGAEKAYPAERLLRFLLAETGWSIFATSFDAGKLPPRSTVSRHDNAFFFTVFAPDSSVRMYMNTPLGAPLLTEMETELSGGDALWHSGKCTHKECRCFVKQETDSVIGAKIQMQAYPNYTSRRHYSGFRNAEVRFFPPHGFENRLEAIHSLETPEWTWLSEDLLAPEWEETPYGKCALFRNVTGYLYFAW